MNKFFQIFLLSILIIISSTNSIAQLVPDFKVNDDNTSYSHFVGKAGSDSSGNFIIVWQDERNSTSAAPNVTIYGQRFNYNGNKIGSNFRVNPIADTAQTPDIVVKKNGDFIVCWTDKSNSNLVMRMFDKYANPLSSITQVCDFVFSNTIPVIGIDDIGNFIIAWEFYLPSTGDMVLFQMFDPAGNKIGVNRNVSDTGVNSRKRNPSLTVNQNGNFIITWEDNRLSHQLYDIYFQRFNALGEKLGNNIKVNSSLTDVHTHSKISSDSSGNFCITWQTKIIANQSYYSICQYYSSTATPLGNNLLIAVNTPPTALFLRPNGEAAIGIAEGNSMKIQRMNSNRTFLGNSFSISSEVPSSWKLLTDLNISNNRIISVWQDNRNGQFDDIYANIRSFSNPDSVTSITQISTEIPSNFTLGQNYPNPFNSSSIIPFELKVPGIIKLKVFNILGIQVQEIPYKILNAGKFEIRFDAINLSNGVYFYLLEYQSIINSETNLNSSIRKFILLK